VVEEDGREEVVEDLGVEEQEEAVAEAGVVVSCEIIMYMRSSFLLSFFIFILHCSLILKIFLCMMCDVCYKFYNTYTTTTKLLQKVITRYHNENYNYTGRY
jgi:hypothetical protein